MHKPKACFTLPSSSAVWLADGKGMEGGRYLPKDRDL